MHLKLHDIDIDKLRKIDREAADILSDALKAAQAIMQKRDELDQAGQQKQTLFVPVGENHGATAQLMHNAFLAAALSELESGAIIYGLEHDYNLLPADQCDLVMNLKQYGEASLEYILGQASTQYADFANRFLNKTLLNLSNQRQNILLSFTDVTGNENQINLDDHQVKQAYDNVFTADFQPDEISPISAEGAALRNYFMAQNLKDIAELEGARIALQLCGQGHVGGHQYWSIDHSLCATFAKMNQPFFAVLNRDSTYLQNAAQLPEEFKITSENVPDYKTIYHATTGKLDPANEDDCQIIAKENPQFTARDEEAKFVNGKLVAMGLADHQIHLTLK